MPKKNKKLKIAVLGGNGMLGSDLVTFLETRHDVTAIDRENYDIFEKHTFDVLINANGNSRRFWANANPKDDFMASTASVMASLFDFPAERYIYISSSDVYREHDSPKTTSEDQTIATAGLGPYGFHKYLSEQLVREYAKKYLILRPSLMLGTHLKKGPIYDILEGNPLFITPDSRLQMITTEAVAEVIDHLLEQNIAGEVMNVGGQGAVSFTATEDIFGKKIAISPEAQKQEYEMNVEKLAKLYPLKTSKEYLEDFLSKTNESR